MHPDSENRLTVVLDFSRFYLKHAFKVLFEADFEIGNGFFMNDYVMSLEL